MASDLVARLSHRLEEMLAQAGRALIAIGVAYLIRALTASDMLPKSAGISLGLVYALSWLALSTRAAGRGDVVGALFSAALPPLMAFPLIIESTFRFGALSGPLALFAVAVVAVPCLVAAAAINLQTLAWLSLIGSLTTATVVMVRTNAFVPAEVLFIALGVATLWLGYVRDWVLLRWPAALVADIVATGVLVRATRPAAGESASIALVLLLALFGSYFVSTVIRTLLLARKVVWFEVVQSAVLLPLTIAGAATLVPLIGGGRPILAGVMAVLGAIGYVTAFAFVDRRQSDIRNTHFYAAIGFALLVSSAITAFGGGWRVASFLLGAGVLGVISIRLRRTTFVLHALGFAIAGAVASNVLVEATQANVGSTAQLSLSATALIVCGVLAVCTWLLAAEHPDGQRLLALVSMLVGAVLCLWSASGLLISAIAIAAEELTGSVSPGALATIRTVSMSMVVLAAAAMARVDRLRPVTWLAYPALLIVALKLLVEDLRVSQPTTLFVALAVYGATLMFISRVRHRPTKDES